MDNLEKLLFLDITSRQFGNLDTGNFDFISIWESMNEAKKVEYTLLSKEIHEIWSFINMPIIVELGSKRVNSVWKYNECVHPVNQKILSICNDFSLSFKEELSIEYVIAAKKVLGDDYFTWFKD